MCSGQRRQLQLQHPVVGGGAQSQKGNRHRFRLRGGYEKGVSGVRLSSRTRQIQNDRPLSGSPACAMGMGGIRLLEMCGVRNIRAKYRPLSIDIIKSGARLEQKQGQGGWAD